MSDKYSDHFWRVRSILDLVSKDDYDTTIVPNRDKDVREYNNLFKDCFSHHLVHSNNYVNDKLVVEKKSLERPIHRDNLAAYFLKNNYTPVCAYETDSINEEDQEESKISYEQLVARITENPISPHCEGLDIGTNRLAYLLGKVGEGKSSLVHKIVQDIWEKTDRDDESMVIPVKIDLEKEFMGLNDSLQEIGEKFYLILANRIRDSLYSHRDNRLADLCNLQTNIEKEPILFIRKLTKVLWDKKIRIFIAIDNIDRYHFRFMKHAFFDEIYKEQIDSVKRNIGGLIGLFKKDGFLESAGLCVVFCCRRYVYRFMKRYNPASLDEDRELVFQVERPTLNAVIESRMQLFDVALKAVIEESEGKRREWQQGLAEIKVLFNLKQVNTDVYDSKFNHDIMEIIYRLCHHGFRSLVTFISNLSYDYRKPEITNRLLRDSPLTLLLLYLIAGKRRYTQGLNHFPNMFLCDAIIKPDQAYLKLHKPHVHTYWLKYLILKYIIMSPNRKSGGVSKDEIINFFCDRQKGAYERELVLLALGSLCTSNEYRCADVEYEMGVVENESYKIAPSERGLSLLSKGESKIPSWLSKSDFCFSFLYLQIIADDGLLAYPNCIQKGFRLPGNYKYLYSDGANYGRMISSVLATRANLVCRLFQVLTESFTAEIMEYREDLHKDLISRSMVPDFGRIAASLQEEIKALYKPAGVREEPPSMSGAEYSKSSVMIREELRRYYAEQPALVAP
jgi:hypothetical protein